MGEGELRKKDREARGQEKSDAMFKSAEMQKIRVTGLRSDLERVIRALHEMGEVDFRKVKDGYFEADAPLEHFADISEQLVRMRGLESMLVPQKPAGMQKVGDWRKVVEECRAMQIDAVLRGMMTRRDELKRKKVELTARVAVLKQLEPLNVDLDAIRGGLLGAVAGTMQSAKLADMKKRVEKATKHFDYKAAEISKGKSVVLVAYEKSAEQAVKEALAAGGFAEIPSEGIHGKPAAALREAQLGLHDIDINSKRLDEELSKISKEKWARIVALREALDIEEQRCIITRKFGRSSKLFSLEGWIVKNHFAKVESELSALTGKRIEIERLERKVHGGGHGHGAHGADAEELPPTMLQNPAALAPYENLVKFISMPSSDELDPTIIFALTFPIIYGMMLGDVGSGIISFLFAWWLLRKFKNPLLQTVCKVWMLGAASAIIFGIIYDEWFGFSHSHLLGLPAGGALYHGMPRLANTTLLLGLVILVGAAHIMLGFILGFINAWNHGDRKHAAAKLGWIGVELGGIALVMTFLFNMFGPEIGLLAGAIFGISLIPIVMAEGPLGLIEIPSLAGNILSYARVMAVGLAGVVVVEEIINKMVVPDPASGLMFLIILPIYMVLQVLHVVIDMFEALVQGARLNLIEFFSKFYKGGGVPFEPFKVERKHTME
ncbi:MAG: V-type ATPase 116kDa subunit family protein [Candidatus Burarchaeum sp.]|nr:V-type ATPase 116kDa subunit family protein [Candidatus Burarchaeum sp.]MDO8339257.1 V-type ATPase 116kDa subunit family protein [Candidatus Burarchaeum sp.]